ncbi:MAG: sulfatase [Blastopirellula sp.]|nr:MAG: sulfatase [Blastopirellula sp.]
MTPNYSRRSALKAMSCGFGYMAFAGLAAEAAAKESFQNPLAPKTPHFEPKAKRVIMLCMRGGPSHVDTFDYKPMLAKHAGESPGGVGGLNNQKGRKLMPSPWKFSQHGESGLPISELYPHLSKHADDLCLINGAYTDIPNHPQALVQLHTGQFQFVRPSMGAWTLYGLGSECQDLPGFITIKPPARLGGAQNYGSAFLPAIYQGTRVGSVTDTGIGNLENKNFTGDLQTKQIDLLQSMNRQLAKRHPQNSQIDGVIESYELASRMQSAVPEVMSLEKESAPTLKKYGVNEKATNDFGRQCLLARRLAEAGVRFIELTHEGWDQHSGLKAKLTSNTKATDQPIAALISDLKQRDMLKDTLIIWTGEFGRTPAVKKADGRDHNGTGFSMWMAGGGVKGGLRYGATDEFGITAQVDKFHVHDFHATALHLLGLNHKQLTYRYAGRDFRLTDVYGKVAKKIIA